MAQAGREPDATLVGQTGAPRRDPRAASTACDRLVRGARRRLYRGVLPDPLLVKP